MSPKLAAFLFVPCKLLKLSEMKLFPIWATILTAIVFFVSGFLVANYLNRSELSTLRAENDRLRTVPTPSPAPDQLSLTTEEIDAKIKEAEQNATNFSYQKGLGLGLYRYGALKQDKTLIEKSIPILERATKIDPNDLDVLIGLGHAYYDSGFFGKDNAQFDKARETYNKVLVKRPKEIEVITDLGRTFMLQNPPDYPAATKEFERALAIDPKHEKTLESIIASSTAMGVDASNYRERLRAVNPNNVTLQTQNQAPSEK